MPRPPAAGCSARGALWVVQCGGGGSWSEQGGQRQLAGVPTLELQERLYPGMLVRHASTPWCFPTIAAAHLLTWARPAAAGAFQRPAPRPARVQRTAQTRHASHAARQQRPTGGAAPARVPPRGWPTQRMADGGAATGLQLCKPGMLQGGLQAGHAKLVTRSPNRVHRRRLFRRRLIHGGRRLGLTSDLVQQSSALRSRSVTRPERYTSSTSGSEVSTARLSAAPAGAWALPLRGRVQRPCPAGAWVSNWRTAWCMAAVGGQACRGTCDTGIGRFGSAHQSPGRRRRRSPSRI